MVSYTTLRKVSRKVPKTDKGHEGKRLPAEVHTSIENLHIYSTCIYLFTYYLTYLFPTRVQGEEVGK